MKKRLSWDEMLQVQADKLNEYAFVPFQIKENADELFSCLARMTVDIVKENNDKGLPTKFIWPCGPKRQFPIIAELTNKENVSWKNTYNFQMDEWLDWQCRPLRKDHPFNLQEYLKRELFAKIDPSLQPDDGNMFFHDPLKMGYMDEMLDKYGPADCVFGGFGFTGHFAYNEPNPSRWYSIDNETFKNGRTRIVPTNEETFIMHSHRSTGGNTRLIPPFGITIGMKDLLASKKIVLVSDGGAWKQTIFRILLMHEPTEKYPCTFAQEHPDALVLVDKQTAECPPYAFTN